VCVGADDGEMTAAVAILIQSSKVDCKDECWPMRQAVAVTAFFHRMSLYAACSCTLYVSTQVPRKHAIRPEKRVIGFEIEDKRHTTCET
jgi:hypothetical protein